MGDMLGPEADQPLYAAAAHQRWYAAGSGGGGRGVEGNGEGGGARGTGRGGCRPGGPPRVCLVSYLVSRVPSTPYLLRSYRRRAAGDPAGFTTGDPTVTALTAGELPGEHRAGVVHALRATTAAPWYMEELVVDKELGLGRLSVSGAGQGQGQGQGRVDGGDGAHFTAGTGVASSAGATPKDRGGGKNMGDGSCRGSCMSGSGDGSGGDGGGGNRDGGRTEGNDAGAGLHTAAGMAAAAADVASLAKVTTDPAEASRVTAALRFIDGAIACNNPTAVGIFEARRLFPRHRPLCVVSLGRNGSKAGLPKGINIII